MKKIITLVVLSSFLLGGCTTTPQNPAPTTIPKNPSRQAQAMVLPTKANLFYIKLEDAGLSGKLIGCNDSSVGVPIAFDSVFTSREEVLTFVYTKQLTNVQQPSDLTNAINNSLELINTTVNNGIATIALSGSLNVGGVCDIPRIKEQLTAPALQFTEITQVVITINGKPLNDEFSGQ